MGAGRVLGVVCAGAAAGWLGGCFSSEPTARPEAALSGQEPEMAMGAVKRMGTVDGAVVAAAEYDGANWRAGTAVIDTPLPAGYPAPTPPGAIEIKRYPSVRRAEVTMEMEANVGQNIAFFPLFNHIKRRNIAMTSPVEMDYEGFRLVEGQEPDQKRVGPERWTMAFLYRTPEQGPSGEDPSDERVTVRDTPPMTYLAVGFQGGYGTGQVRRHLDTLEAWLEAHPEWEAVGDARSLAYNGPNVPGNRRWGEVQVPVRLRAKR